MLRREIKNIELSKFVRCLHKRKFVVILQIRLMILNPDDEARKSLR